MTKRMGRPEGEVAYEMDDEWKRLCRAERKRRGWSNEELGDRVGTTGPNISNTLKPISAGGYKTSAFAPRIGIELGIPLPSAPPDPEAQKMRAKLERLRLLAPPVAAELDAEIDRAIDEMERLLQRTKKARNRKA